MGQMVPTGHDYYKIGGGQPLFFMAEAGEHRGE